MRIHVVSLQTLLFSGRLVALQEQECMGRWTDGKTCGQHGDTAFNNEIRHNRFEYKAAKKRRKREMHEK
jgi:hypothetical protein